MMMHRRILTTATTLGLLLAGAVAAQPCGSSSASEGAALYPLPADGAWGFVGTDGEWRLTPQWRQVRPFAEGIAAVEAEAGWGLVDSNGDYLVEPGAQDADRVVIDGESFALSPYKPASGGCIAATPEDGQAHYITASGERWTPPAFANQKVVDLGSFSDGLAWVRVEQGKHTGVGWIDTAGEMVIPPDFTDGGNFEDGRAPAAINSQNWGYIDGRGELVFPRKFVLEEAGPYGNGLAPVRLGGESGFMGDADWAIKSVVFPDGRETAIRAAAPFHEGRAAVQPGPVWIDSAGQVVVNPQAGARMSVCNEQRLPTYHHGFLPLVVGDGTNICGNTPDITYEGPGDPRSGPRMMLWALPWERDKLVWLDREGATAIDSSACRRAPGVAALPVKADGGGLAEGAYRFKLSGMVAGASGPYRADAPCNRSEFEMDGNMATNAEGPWRLSLTGEATWQDKPVGLTLSLALPEGLGVGEHPVKSPGEDKAVSAYLWLGVKDAGPNAPRPATYVSTDVGTLTLERRDQGAISGAIEMTLVSRENAQDTVNLMADFNAIPYTRGPEVVLLETTGAVTDLDESMPDDPLINFFTPARAMRTGDALTLSLGKHGPKLEVSVPANHSGVFSAGPEGAASIRFADVPVTGKGQLQSRDGRLSGQFTTNLAAHDQIDGAGSVTLRFAEVPVEGQK